MDEEASLILVHHGSRMACRIVDISQGGCRVLTKDRFQASIMVRLEILFKVRGLAFRFSGVSQWSDGRHQVGIRFVDVIQRRRDELMEALEELAAAQVAKAERDTAAWYAAEAGRPPVQPAPALSAESERDGAAGIDSFIPPPARKPRADSLGLVFTQALESEADADSPAAASAPFEEQPEIPAAKEAPAAAPLLEEEIIPLNLDAFVPREVRSQPAPPAPLNPNRRAQERQPVETSATIYLVNIASRLSGHILDLALSGCRIRCDERFPVGIYTRVETEFRLEGLPFRLGGVVQAIHDRHHIGIRFLDISERKRAQLEQLIEEIKEEHGETHTEKRWTDGS